MLTGELQGATDHAAVMTPDREVPRSTEQGLEVLEVGAVDLRACTVRDVRGLFVRSLDKTDPGRFPVVFAEVVHQGVDAPSVRVLRDAEGVVHRLSRDPLTSESQEERHRVARTPHWGQIDSEPEAARPSFTRVSRTTCRT